MTQVAEGLGLTFAYNERSPYMVHILRDQELLTRCGLTFAKRWRSLNEENTREAVVTNKAILCPDCRP